MLRSRSLRDVSMPKIIPVWESGTDMPPAAPTDENIPTSSGCSSM